MKVNIIFGGRPGEPPRELSRKEIHLIVEILEACRREMGKDYPIICRISADDFLPNGNSLKETKVVARLLQEAGVNALHVVSGGHVTTAPSTP